jgi:hypothetical protein
MLARQSPKDLVSEIRTLDTQLKANAQAIARLVAATGSTLTEVVGDPTWPAG